MKKVIWILTAVVLAIAANAYAANELRIGATAGPYADQLKLGIKPLLEKKGYKVTVVEFNDYVQPNLALAQGDLDANAFQHTAYLDRFSAEHKLELTPIIQVPTAPIGIYSRKHKSLDEVKAGTTVAMPNEPVNQARSLVMLAKFGWITLKSGIDPTRVSERDIVANPKQVKILPLEPAQTPRALEDVDYAFVNGNYAIASGLKLTDALALENPPDYHIVVVTIRTKDKDKPFVKDLVDAYHTKEFRAVVDKYFAGYVRPGYLR
jgi:D-methionine transport system substrate-binding protein